MAFFVFLAASTWTGIVATRSLFSLDGKRRIEKSLDIGDVFRLVGFDADYVTPTML